MSSAAETRARERAELRKAVRAAAKAARPLSDVEAAARSAPPVRGFARALTGTAATGPALIAEIKSRYEAPLL